MKKYAFINPNGDAEYTASPATDDTYTNGEIYNGLTCREIPQDADDFEVIERWYWKDGTQYVRPAKPSDFHDWSSITEAWVPDYGRVQSHLHRELDRERERRNQLAIEVVGVMYDGNNTAQTNLKNKIEEVRSRIELGIAMPAELLVWRDANNQTHSWTDINSYYQFLQTYAIALADRGTGLYIKMWQHKANIAALEDIDAILAYDVTQGWPT